MEEGVQSTAFLALRTVKSNFFGLFSPQDPGQHGWQHHRALLQRRHLRPQHRELRGRVQGHADGDLTRGGRGWRCCDWLLVGCNLRGCYWRADKADWQYWTVCLGGVAPTPRGQCWHAPDPSLSPTLSRRGASRRRTTTTRR